MSGGLLQLVAYGTQDVYITGNPEITFFKMIYRRHTNFSTELKEICLDGIPSLTKTSIVIPRKGDLVSQLYLKVVLPEIKLSKGSKFAWSYLLGFNIVRQLEVEIGGSIINKYYNTWSLIWYSLARNNQLDRSLTNMMGVVPEMYTYNGKNKPAYTLYIPLIFYFSSRMSHRAIPLIALQYHAVQINFYFQNLKDIIIANDKFLKCDANQLHIKEATLLATYIYLDSEERRQLASTAHEYLIAQIQRLEPESIQTPIQSFDLNFNHPTREIYWVVERQKYVISQKFIYYPYSEINTIPLFAKQLLYESIKLACNCNDHRNSYGFEFFYPHTTSTTENKKITVVNKSSRILIFNTRSLIYNRVNYVNKVYGVISVDKLDRIKIDVTKTTLTIEDLSIPACKFVDTRFYSDNPHINMRYNAGMNIDTSVNPVLYGKLIINGVDRFSRRDGNYFNYVLPDQYHRNTPGDGVNIYSFCLTPENPDPSGTINFSRIDSAKLLLEFRDVDFNKDKLYIFAQSYNILRITSGLGGLAYVT